MRALKIISCAAIMQALWMLGGCCNGTSDYGYTGLAAGHLNTSGTTPAESHDNSIPAGAYGIRITLTSEELFTAHVSTIPSAYATSCWIIPSIRDSVRAIRIEALEDGSGSTPRDVTEDFRASSRLSLDTTPTPLPDLAERMNQDRLGQADLIRVNTTEHSTATRFIVILELASGTTLADTTAPVRLL